MSEPTDETISSPPPAPTPVSPAPSRRSPLDYFNPGNARDQFWRLFSSREKVIENLKTLAWVIPITLVIWIYAEREQVVVPAGPNVFNVAVEVVSGDARRWVEMVGGPKQTVNLKLTGPQQALEKVRAELTMVTAGLPQGLTIHIPASMAIANNQPVNVVDHIQDNPIFRTNGVTVEASEPANIYVNIDKLGQRELPVKIPPGITNLTAQTRFDPPKVTVTGPDSLLQLLVDSPLADLKAYANLTGNDLLKSEGHHTVPFVQVTLSPPQERLRVDPAQLRADIDVRAADVSYTIENLPITLNVSPSTMNNFTVQLTSGESATFTVTGPQEQIDAIKSKQLTPVATLDLDRQDYITNQPKRLRYTLPDGVKVNPDSDHPVEFKLTPRE